MNFFNLDMHISIVHDVKNIFRNLGHTIDSTNLSGHTWVNDEKQGRNKVVNSKNWKNIDQELCDRFYKKYRKKLSTYDGFIHSYPPAFALLFEKFEKPIVTIACTRFDYPINSSDIDWLIQGLRRLNSNGQLIPIANNSLDKYYCEQWLNFEWQHISSLCDYMESRYRPEKDRFITWHRSNLQDLQNIMIDQDFTINKRYDRTEISKYLGVVHIPYNLSIMSAFEQYYQGIPLFFPSQEFQSILYTERDDMLKEILFPGSPLQFSEKLIALADWYDPLNMPFINYYDSFELIDDWLLSINLQNVSGQMHEYNKIRRETVYSQWSKVLERIR